MKSIKVSTLAWERLRQRAFVERTTITALVDAVVLGLEPAPPQKIPAEGWREPASVTAEVTRPLPAQKAGRPSAAQTRAELQARTDEITGKSDLKVELDDDVAF